MSVPRMQIQVSSRISPIASGIRTHALSAASSRPKVSSVKLTPTSASDPITSTPVIVIAQPPIQPNHGPIARVTQLNVVPQSWSTRFRYRNAVAISAIGTNEASSTPGAYTPTSAAIGPITAAREYAGDVAFSPMTSESTNPIAPALSSPCSVC